MVDINLYIDTNDKLKNNSTTEFDKLHCIIEDTNETSINLYSNTNYTFSLKDNEVEILNEDINSKFYFAIFDNYTYYLDSTTKSGIIYKYGTSTIRIDTNNIIKTTTKFKLVDMNKNYTWCIFKYNVSKNSYDEYKSGKIIINNPLIYVKLFYDGVKMIHNEFDPYYNQTKDHIYIDNNEDINSNRQNIILYNNYNYLFELDYNGITTYFFDIYANKYMDYNKLTENNTVIGALYEKNIVNTKKNNFIWIIKDSTSVLHTGNILFDNLEKYNSNDEIYYDAKFKNIDIKYKLIYDTFLYNETINIIKLNNSVNSLLTEYSNKLLIIDNINTNVSLIIPSTNIYVGLTFKILFNIDLNILNIYFEDNTQTLDNYDKFKGSLFISNLNNLYCKTVCSNIELLENNEIETNLSENIIVKKIKLNNGNTYNGGLFKYSCIKIICTEYVNNKYIWNIEGEVLGNSIIYTNTYLYNPFI